MTDCTDLYHAFLAVEADDDSIVPDPQRLPRPQTRRWLGESGGSGELVVQYVVEVVENSLLGFRVESLHPIRSPLGQFLRLNQ